MNIAIIPARGGSRRIPGKNKRKFDGIPLIAHSIRTAKKTCIFHQIIVSTDDPDIAAIAMEYGAIAMYRAAKYCVDECGTQDVISSCMNAVPQGALICGIYATCPLMLAEDIQRGHRVLVENEDLHYTMAVADDPLRSAAQFYWGRYDAFLKNKPLIAAHTAMIPIQDQYVCDINTEDDFQRAWLMYKLLHGIVEGKPDA